MLAHVTDIIPLLVEAFPTYATFMTLLASMISNVVIQTASLLQHLPTDVTFVLLLRAVDLF